LENIQNQVPDIVSDPTKSGGSAGSWKVVHNFFQKATLSLVDVTPETVTEASRESGKLSALSSIKWVVIRR